MVCSCIKESTQRNNFYYFIYIFGHFSLVCPYGLIYVKMVYYFDPTDHWFNFATERRTWSQNDALVIRNQLKEPIPTILFPHMKRKTTDVYSVTWTYLYLLQTNCHRSNFLDRPSSLVSKISYLKYASSGVETLGLKISCFSFDLRTQYS